MSISATLNNAFTGLTAAARGADVISQNLANALTDGYGRRQLELSSRSLGGAGGGVTIEGVSRQISPAILADRRLADAREGGSQRTRNFLAAIEAALGAPGEPGALTARYEAFESALTAAISRPDSGPRLNAVLDAAKALTAQFGMATDAIQAERSAADQAIATEVETLNSALDRLVELNRDVRVAMATGNDANAYLDERQRLVDQVSAIVPVREIPRENGQIALITTGGAVLLDGLAAEVGFTPTATIVAGMSVESGALSGLTLRGLPVSATAEGGLLGGGSLGANFTVRDNLAPLAQQRLDAVARDLVERFQDPAADPTRTAGSPGLFTDWGAALDPANETGLAGRLRVNALADPAQGGEAWRLRDGLGAVAPGPVGQAAGLMALANALTGLREPASGGFSPGNRSAPGLVADMLAGIGVARQTAESDLAYAAARRENLRGAELASGVDTDQELQRLLVVEKAYAANARVVTAAEAMLDRLMEI